MYALLEYVSSFLIWVIFLTIIFFLTRRIRNIFLYKLKYADFIFLAMLLNAVFYLLRIKGTELFTCKFDEIKYTSNEPWGVIGIEFFFDKVINWLLIILLVLLLALRGRK